MIYYSKDKIKFVLPIKPRTKKNHGQLITLKTGKQIMLPAKSYLEFEREVIKFVKAHPKLKLELDVPINLKCCFYKDKNYKSDLVGYLQAIQDALVEAGVLKDDNTKIVYSTDGSFVDVDKDNPRIEILITFLKEKNGKDY